MTAFINAIGPWLVGGIVFGFPVWLAWWLSDGFSGFSRDSYRAPGVHYGPVFNGSTGHTGCAPINSETGQPLCYPD